MRRFAAVTLALALAACNAILDVGEPVVVEEPRDDGDRSGPPAACGDEALENGEPCDAGTDAPRQGCVECALECDGPRELFEPDTSTCYLFATTPLAWEAARDACATWGGHLAVIGSEPEHTLVQNRITADTWIGARAVDDAYAWIDGEVWDFAPWAPGRPAGGGCVQIHGDLVGFWDDECSTPLEYLCERPPEGQRPK